MEGQKKGWREGGKDSKKRSHIALMSSGKKWDTVATHTHTHTYTHCSSVHLERGEINHALQKDESPGAVAPSKQEKEGASEGRIILQKWREMQQQNEKTKEGEKKHRSDKKKVFKKVSTADSWICAEITNCRRKASTRSSTACRRP